MSTYNGKSFSDIKNLNLKGGATGTGLLRWSPPATGARAQNWGANPFTTTDYGLYINTAGALVFASAGTTTTLGAAGAASNPTWNTVWGAAQTLQLAGVATFTIDNNTGNNNVLTLTNTGTGSGVLLQITNAGTGSDIAGTSASWTISKAGDMTAKSMVFAGTAGTTSLTMTLGDIITSAGGLALTKAANNATLTVTNNTSTSASAIVFVGNGTYTGNTTSSWFTMTPSGLTTGTAVYIATVALTTGKALQLNYAGTTSQTTGIQAQILNSSTAMQATARIFSVSHTGISSASGAGILSEFISAAADATTIVKVTASSTLTGSALWVSAGSITAGTGLLMTLTGVTTGKGIDMGTLTGLTTGVGLSMLHTTSTIADGGSMIRLSSTAANTGGATNGTMLDIQTTAQVAGTQVLIKGAAVTTGVLLSLSTTTGMTSGSVIRASTSTAGAIATNGVFSFNASGAFTSGAATVGAFHVAGAATVAGTIMSILGGSQTTGVGLYISDPSAGMTSGSLLRIATATTGAIATNGVVSISASGNFSTAAAVGLVSVQADSTTAGYIMNISGAALTTGIGLYLANGTSAMTTGSLISVAASGTGTIATNGIVAIRHAGICLSTSNAGLLDVQASAAVGAMTVVNIKATAASQTATNVLNVVQSGATITAYTASVASFTGGFSGNSSTGNVIGVTAVNTTAGDAILVSNNALTVGAATMLKLTHTTSVLGAGTSMVRISSTGVDTGSTTGTLLDLSQTASVGNVAMLITDASADTGARTDLKINVTNAAAVGAIPLSIQSAAVQGTGSKFKKMAVLGGVTLWVGLDAGGNTANGQLTATAGDILFNGGSNKPEYCTGTNVWVALV